MKYKRHYDDISLKVTKNEIFQRLYCGDTLVLTYQLFYSQFSGCAFPKAIHKINRYYRWVASTYQNYYQTIFYKTAVEAYKAALNEGFPFNPYEANLVYEVTLNQDCALSLYFDRYEYLGGAHGSTVRFSDTWHLIVGHRVMLSELFPNKKEFQPDLLLAITDEIQKDATVYFEEFKKNVPSSFDPRNYYLSPHYLNIYFQQYDIAPYSSGIPVFPITYERVGAIRLTCK